MESAAAQRVRLRPHLMFRVLQAVLPCALGVLLVRSGALVWVVRVPAWLGGGDPLPGWEPGTLSAELPWGEKLTATVACVAGGAALLWLAWRMLTRRVDITPRAVEVRGLARTVRVDRRVIAGLQESGWQPPVLLVETAPGSGEFGGLELAAFRRRWRPLGWFNADHERKLSQLDAALRR